MQKQWSETTSCKKISGPRTNRADRTIDDFTDGRDGALSMTSPMDATEGGRWTPHRDTERQQIGPLALSMTSPMDARGHYRIVSMTSPMDATEGGEQNNLKQLECD